MKSIYAAPLVIATLAISCIGGCGGNSSGSNLNGDGTPQTGIQLNLSGRLGASYTIAGNSWLDGIYNVLFGSKAIASGVTADKVWALPTVHGAVTPSAFSSMQVGDIGTDGSFSLQLSKDYDWVLLLIDTTEPLKRDQVKAYIAMSDIDGSMLEMPMQDASSNIDLGTLEPSGNEAVSSTSLADNADKFTLSLAQLKEIARTDDVLKSIKNTYINYDDTTGTYLNIQPFFGWRDESGSISIYNMFSDPATTIANHNNGYSYYFNTNSNAIDFTKVCDQSVLLTLHPPATVTRVGGTPSWGTTTPFTNSGTVYTNTGTVCGGGDLYLRNDGSELSFNYAGGVFWATPIVSGYWEIKYDGTKLFEFDGTLGSPFENDDITKPIVYIPALKAVVTNGTIDYFELKWYLRNSNGGYDEITDFTTFSHSVENASVYLTQYSGTRIDDSIELTAATNYASAIPPRQWTFLGQSTTSGAFAEEITVTYQMNGIGLRFEWR